MAMRERDVREMPADIGALGERLFKPDNPYRVIGDHLPELLSGADFAGLYAPTGRAAVWPATPAPVTLFRFREHLPDRRAAEAVAARLDWKYALRLPLGYAGFDHADLCNFRKRLAEKGPEALVFDALLRKVAALGFLKERGKQRTDSTAVVAAVRELSALELANEALRVCVRALERAAPAWAARAVPASFRERYAHRAGLPAEQGGAGGRPGRGGRGRRLAAGAAGRRPGGGARAGRGRDPTRDLGPALRAGRGPGAAARRPARLHRADPEPARPGRARPRSGARSGRATRSTSPRRTATAPASSPTWPPRRRRAGTATHRRACARAWPRGG
jgi:transposase